MYKADIQHAFRLIPVHPDDWPILGMVWQGRYYVDKLLPFGLHSSPALFNHLADAVCWFLRSTYALHHLEHYLDDFMGVAPPSQSVSTSAAALQMSMLLTVFENLGIPVATGADKVIYPTTVMTVLGVDLDSVTQETRLPDSKLSALLDLLRQWSTRKSATKRELLSLIGHLSFAAKVVPPGRTFIRCLLDLNCSVQHLSDTIEVDEEPQLDISWWLTFGQTWNGKAMFHDVEWTRSPDLELFMDASNVGYGGYLQGHWFSGGWSAQWEAEPIMVLELIPIAAACTVWGELWIGKKLVFHCDNGAVVWAWQKGSCRNRTAMKFIRCILGKAAHHNFILYIQHIAGVKNDIADALSRFQMDRFHKLAPSAATHPTQLPPIEELC